MSDIRNKIAADRITAIKSRDTQLKSILTTLLGEINTKEKGSNETITDIEVIDVIRSFEKSIRYNQSKGVDTEEQRFELEVLSRYAPSELTENEIEEFLTSKPNWNNIGVAMGMLKEAFPGRVNGSVASGVIRKLLSTGGN